MEQGRLRKVRPVILRSATFVRRHHPHDRMLKNAFLAFFKVACERRDFRCAPEIKRWPAHDFAGPSVARTSRLLFNSLMVKPPRC